LDKELRQVAILAGCVYFLQGALGLTAVALPIYLRNSGLSIREITTLTSLAAIPWVIKIIYGLISDTIPLFSYRRKSYLILFAIFACVGWWGLAVLPGLKFFVFLALTLSNLGLAATDVITDGYIVEHSESEKSHIFQSIAWGFRSFGAIISGYLGGWMTEHIAPQKIFMIASFLPVLVIIISFNLVERKFLKSPFQSVKEPLMKCFQLLKQPLILNFIFLLLLSQVASSFGMPFFFYMKEKLQFGESFLGTLISLGWIGVVLTSFFYAKYLKHLKPKTILYWAFLFNAINILSTFFIYNQLSALILVFIGGVLACLTLLPIMSVSAMLSHNTGVEGTLFAVLMSIHNLGQIIFAYVGGVLYERIGLWPLVGGSAIITALGLILIMRFNLENRPIGALSQ